MNKEEENKYSMFYKCKLDSIKVYYIYVNKYKVVEVIKEDKYLFDEENVSILKKDMLIKKIKKNMYLNEKEYKLISLLKFNIDIDPEDVINMKIDKIDGTEYLTYERGIKDILFNDTIRILQDVNSLYFVYEENLNINKRKCENKTNKNKKELNMKRKVSKKKK